MIVETVDRLLRDKAGATPATVAQALEDLGLPAMLVPDGDGPGMATPGEAADVVIRIGYHMAPVSIADMILAAGGRLCSERGALSRSLLMAGALSRLLDDCVDYAGTRKQFGRPIGNFQAVQQMLAVLAGEAAAAGIGARFAASRLGRPDFGLAVAAAKIRCGQAAGRGMRIAHQVFGAIGFTREHHLHRLTNGLRDWRDDFGTEHHWAEHLGQAARQAGALWPFITAIGSDGSPQ
ncbi:MAG: hypothetical protein J0H82_16615 [Alphaproteobacteria bacterium]|jgi:alkylation response protein AidB-like acyl-CoA dehydrogenase|nr:hypothetical protein [Alphaproteobacteria bacterium]